RGCAFACLPGEGVDMGQNLVDFPGTGRQAPVGIEALQLAAGRPADAQGMKAPAPGGLWRRRRRGEFLSDTRTLLAARQGLGLSVGGLAPGLREFMFTQGPPACETSCMGGNVGQRRLDGSHAGLQGRSFEKIIAGKMTGLERRQEPRLAGDGYARRLEDRRRAFREGRHAPRRIEQAEAGKSSAFAL